MAGADETPRRRGRPKGSGLDDSATLADIRALLAEKPGLRPTTAIKELGIVDASTIRRLRDKLMQSEASAQPRPSQNPAATFALPRSIPAQARRLNQENPRSGAGTRARARLGMPTDGAWQQQPRPTSTRPTSITPSAQLPTATATSVSNVLEQLKLVLEATTTLNQLQQALLAQLGRTSEQTD